MKVGHSDSIAAGSAVDALKIRTPAGLFVRRLNSLRSELIDPLIGQHGGHIVKTMGDGLLLEFPRVVAAVECCINIQKSIGTSKFDPFRGPWSPLLTLRGWPHDQARASLGAGAAG